MALPVRTEPDVSRIKQALGGDKSLWVAIGLVEGTPFVDPDEGVFVMVKIMPDEFKVCCRVLTWYSGDGFGVYFPLRAGEQVLVDFPGADTFGAPCIVGRIPSRDEKPPTEFDNATGILKMKAGEDLRVLTQGAGEVRLGDGTNESNAARFTELQNYVTQLATALVAHVHPGVVNGGGSTGPSATVFPNDISSARSGHVKID